MGSVIEPPALDQALAEAKARLRIDGTGEDEILAGLIGTATALCEAFIGQWLMRREGAETIPACAQWQRLRASPVQAILGVDALPAAGEPMPLGVDAYAVDIDASGDGWARVLDAGDAGLARVRFAAGMAAGDAWADLPEPLRQGILRLVAHLHAQRAGGDGSPEPPAAVTALWRPWRRMRLR